MTVTTNDVGALTCGRCARIVASPHHPSHPRERGPSMIRKFEVSISGTVTLNIDDEARSEWKPEQGILDTFRDPERFNEGSTLDDLLHHLAIVVGVDNRNVGGTDGWADFPHGCVTEGPWPDWELDGVREVGAESEARRG